MGLNLGGFATGLESGMSSAQDYQMQQLQLQAAKQQAAEQAAQQQNIMAQFQRQGAVGALGGKPLVGLPHPGMGAPPPQGPGGVQPTAGGMPPQMPMMGDVGRGAGAPPPMPQGPGGIQAMQPPPQMPQGPQIGAPPPQPQPQAPAGGAGGQPNPVEEYVALKKQFADAQMQDIYSLLGPNADPMRVKVLYQERMKDAPSFEKYLEHKMSVDASTAKWNAQLTQRQSEKQQAERDFQQKQAQLLQMQERGLVSRETLARMSAGVAMARERMRDATQQFDTQARIAAQERGQDMSYSMGQERLNAGAGSLDKRLKAFQGTKEGAQFSQARMFNTSVQEAAMDPAVLRNPAQQLSMVNEFLRAATGRNVIPIAEYKKLLEAKTGKDWSHVAFNKLGTAPILGPDQIRAISSAMEGMYSGAKNNLLRSSQASEAADLYPEENWDAGGSAPGLGGAPASPARSAAPSRPKGGAAADPLGIR